VRWTLPWKKNKEIEEPKICCTCGFRETRQTKLTEFGLKFELPKGQKTLVDYGLTFSNETTERVGMHGRVRKYRGSI
tara:strand:- start:1971 stop:2201 length:231 start_codon:yes stop_codon:yes gene_type:complete